MIDCDAIKDLTDDDIWSHLEGNADDEFETIRQHCIKCRGCFETYAEAMQRVKEKDTRRYLLFHKEHLAVRKLELDRYCRENNIKGVDVSKIKDADDYMKICFGMLFKEAGPLFYKWWQKVKPERRGEVLLELMEILEEDSEDLE